MIWKRLRGTRDTVDGSAAIDSQPQLQPIQLFTTAGVISGAITDDGRRVSDLMLTDDEFRIQTDDDGWVSISLADVVLVVPPSHVSTRRIHRAKRRVAFDVPPYRIVGTAHLPPGTQLDPFVLRTGRPALPVTNAWIRNEVLDEDYHAEVAIIAVNAISSARELLGPA